MWFRGRRPPEEGQSRGDQAEHRERAFFEKACAPDRLPSIIVVGVLGPRAPRYQ